MTPLAIKPKLPASTTRIRLAFIISAWIVATAIFSMLKCPPSLADESEGLLRLIGGQYAAGQLVGATERGEILWQSRAFDNPLAISTDHLQRLDAVQPEPAVVNDTFAIEIEGGDCILGRLVQVQNGVLEVESTSLGKIQLPIESMVRLRRQNPAEKYLHEGLQPWNEVEHQDWRREGSAVATDRVQAIWFEEVPFPSRSRIDLRLAWNGRPQFEVIFGAQKDEKSSPTLPRLEVWDEHLVAVSHSILQTDLAKLWTFDEADSELSLTCYLDEIEHRLTVFTATGAFLGALETAADNSVKPGIAIINHGQSLVLHDIKVSPFDGFLPYSTPNREGQTVARRQSVTGSWLGMNSKGRLLEFETSEGNPQSIPLERLEAFTRSPVAQGNSTELEPAFRQSLVTLIDKSQIRGRVQASRTDWIRLEKPDSDLVYDFRTDQVSSLRSTTVPADPKLPESNSTRFLLQMPNVLLRGTFDSLSQATRSTQLRFKPDLSSNVIGLTEDAEGSIFQIQKSRTDRSSSLTVEEHLKLLPGGNSILQANQMALAHRLPHDLQLRTGDVVDATIEKIDDKGVYFRSETTSTTFLSHGLLKSAQLHRTSRWLPLDPLKMNRLLTVPRSQRDQPPTHLFITTEGDYIRGKLRQVSEDSVELEESQANITIPRSSVAIILWLYDRTWETTDVQEATPERFEQFMLHARMMNRDRMTMEVLQHDQQLVKGRNPLLGEVQCSLSEVESLHFGRDIPSVLDAIEVNPWKLRLAKLPLVFEQAANDSAQNSAMLGDDSELLGKAAPNFELKTLEGQNWRLGDQQKKILVLDFWASWCGPCMQALPEVERVVQEFQRPDVQWIGINLEEDEFRVRTTIERLKITSTNLLDKSGGVAEE
jgi:thiol-disulfide isomerase/thioredoxin